MAEYIYRKLDRIEEFCTTPGWWILPCAVLGLVAWCAILNSVWTILQ